MADTLADYLYFIIYYTLVIAVSPYGIFIFIGLFIFALLLNEWKKNKKLKCKENKNYNNKN